MAAIFRAATEGQQPPTREVPPQEGMTLAELQAIGQEVGIAPDAVAQAAMGLDIQRGAVSRTLFGLPIGVARTVDLHRQLSDSEWERLVVQLRETFNARGVTRSDGSLRQWTNGNLQVLLEPTDHGHRLRFGTMNSQGRASIGVGLVAMAMTVFMTISAVAAGNLGSAFPGIALIGVMSTALLARSVIRLPGWARLRARQMEALATHMALPPGAAPAQLPPDDSKSS